MWSISIMEYYSALKVKEILSHATMWMNLKVKGSKSVSKKKGNYMIPLK